jgi:uncharacterized protein YegJ (DUF2314 family)
MMARIGFYVGMVVVGLVGMQFTKSKKEEAIDAFGTSDPITNIAKGNGAMAKARAEARDTLPAFMAHLRNPERDESKFAVKYKIPGSNPAEIIWVADLVPMSTGVMGKLDGMPRTAGRKLGDPVVIASGDIYDWGYMKNGVMQGHYSTKVLIATMPPKQQAAMNSILGWN